MDMKPGMTLVVAATGRNGIGKSGSLPWRLSNEMAYFARVTQARPAGQDGPNAVVMGRKSWESIPAKFRPLKDRINVVLSTQPALDDLKDSPLTHHARSISEALALLPPSTRTFLIGGASLYNAAIRDEGKAWPVPANRMLLTRLSDDVDAAYECDVLLEEVRPERGAKGWKRASHEELEAFVGFQVPRGWQAEVDRNDKSGREVKYEYQMWIRD